MKSTLSLLLVILAGITLLAAEQAGPEKLIRVTKSSPRQIKLTVTAPQPQIKTLSEAGKMVKEVSVAGYLNTATPGMPELPIISSLIAIPPQGSYTLSCTYSGVDYLPLPDPKLCAEGDGDSSAFSGQIFPADLALGSEPAVLRDFRVAQISIYPYQYDLATQQLRHYQNVEVTLDFTDEPGINELPPYTSYSASFAKIYEAQIANFADFRNLIVAPLQPRILLIYGNSTDPTFQSKLNEFITWKRQKGYEVNAVSTSQTGGTSNTAIKTYIQSQYNNIANRPDFIILLGDTGGSFSIPTWYETLSSYNGEGDYPYTHLAGGDLLGDVFIGRISAENISQLATLFAKIYAVEKNVKPPAPQLTGSTASC